MRVLALGILAVVCSVSELALASVGTLRTCRGRRLEFLQQSIRDAKQEGFSVFAMKNSNNKLVGMYAFDSRNGKNASAQVCDTTGTVADEIVTAHSWYYWNEKVSADPARWRREANLSVFQDEGFLRIRVLRPSSSGSVQLSLSLESTTYDEGDVRNIFARDIVTLESLD